MINLQLKASFNTSNEPFVVRLFDNRRLNEQLENDPSNAYFTSIKNDELICTSQFGKFTIYINEEINLHNDVVICYPTKGIIDRFFRSDSRHNTILFTEKCDERCVMCSQPPKEIDNTWRFPLFEEALLLVKENSVIGISGGEPTLYKKQLLDMIEAVSHKRPDISYHILSNCQHLVKEDIQRLETIQKKTTITWGIPLYATSSEQHDLIVGKPGAFNRLIDNLFILASTGATIELRTVLTGLNAVELPKLAMFISNHIPFISIWAIMAMEPIGFAKANREKVFFDHTIFPHPLNSALDICEIRNVNVTLYNFPRCTITEKNRKYCAQSISDWKNKFIPECNGCIEKNSCSGFFEWYNKKWSWEGIQKITN
jgi:His-Xaa-Ser system radical SAM maturase HxsC